MPCFFATNTQKKNILTKIEKETKIKQKREIYRERNIDESYRIIGD